MLALRWVLGSDSRSPIHIILITGTATHIRTTDTFILTGTVPVFTGTMVTACFSRGRSAGQLSGTGIFKPGPRSS